jgi:hypothetical protein
VAVALRVGLGGAAVEPLTDPSPASGHAGHRFVVRTAARDDLSRHLARRGVATEAPPLAGPADVVPELLALPAWAGMTSAQVRRVIIATSAFAPARRPGAGAVCELPTRP